MIDRHCSCSRSQLEIRNRWADRRTPHKFQLMHKQHSILLFSFRLHINYVPSLGPEHARTWNCSSIRPIPANGIHEMNRFLFHIHDAGCTIHINLAMKRWMLANVAEMEIPGHKIEKRKNRIACIDASVSTCTLCDAAMMVFMWVIYFKIFVCENLSIRSDCKCIASHYVAAMHVHKKKNYKAL